MTAFLEELLEYKAWANALFFERCSTLSPEQYTAPQPIKFGSLARTLQHVYDMDLVWKAHLTATRHGFTSRTPQTASPLEDLAASQARLDAWYLDYVRKTDPATLETPLRFGFVEGGEGRMTPAQMLMHVVNHGTYHRGHAAMMLYGFGVKPPGTDLPIRLAEPVSR